MRHCTQAVGILSMLAAACMPAWAGDAQRGALVVERAGCLECHAIGGQGAGHEAPSVPGARDLSENLMAAYTPAAMASALWNHTPAMWRTMAQREVGVTTTTAADWEDAFAFLYSLQFSDKPGEVARGKRVFENNGCSSCHSAAGPGKPVVAWTQLNDPVVLVYRLWDHASTMGAEFTKTKTPWPIMTSRDLMDLNAYVRNAQRLLPESRFSLPEPSSGHLAFEEKCAQCHTGPMALENRAGNQTWMDLGAGMWNHAPLMQAGTKKLPRVDLGEMRAILAFVWEKQYLGPGGNRAAGEHVFESAGCISCHRSPGNGAPMRPRTDGPVTPWSMVALGWGPARTMHQQMLDKGIAWPNLTPAGMNDLTTYLQSLPKQ